MNAGRQLFLTQGFNGSGVQEITAAAGIPKGSFYSYFESKDAFALAVLEQYWKEIQAKFGSILLDPDVEPLERISRYFKALSDAKARHKYAHGCLIGNLSLEIADASAETRSKLSDIFERWENPIVVCLQEARSRGQLTSKRSLRDLAAAIIESWEGAAMRAKVEQKKSSYRRFEELVLPSLFKG
jgi:TetR/AcrR family transcriptional repressor of nem operon